MEALDIALLLTGIGEIKAAVSVGRFILAASNIILGSGNIVVRSFGHELPEGWVQSWHSISHKIITFQLLELGLTGIFNARKILIGLRQTAATVANVAKKTLLQMIDVCEQLLELSERILTTFDELWLGNLLVDLEASMLEFAEYGSLAYFNLKAAIENRLALLKERAARMAAPKPYEESQLSYKQEGNIEYLDVNLGGGMVVKLKRVDGGEWIVSGSKAPPEMYNTGKPMPKWPRNEEVLGRVPERYRRGKEGEDGIKNYRRSKTNDISGNNFGSYSFSKLSSNSSLSASDFNKLNNALVNEPSIRFNYGEFILESPKQFLNEVGDNMYDIIFTDGSYAKFDNSTGRMLYSDSMNNYFVHYTSCNNVSNVEMVISIRIHQIRNYLGLNGSQTINLTHGLGTVRTSATKTTTFIGKTTETILLKNQFGNFNHIRVGEAPGAVNLLNMPDPYWNPATWFEDFNKDWMQRAIKRGDDIYIASPINYSTLVNKTNQGIEFGSYFANELNELINAGVKPINITETEWILLIPEIKNAASMKL